MTQTLGTFGERRLLREIVVPAIGSGGDDCAVVGDVAGVVLATTDPVPEPAAETVAGDADPFWKGWLLVTINASDLAAGGAQPLAFLAALEAPPSYPVESFRRLIDGVTAACRSHGLNYAGGNLREGSRVTGTGTAIGLCRGWAPLTRSKAKVGDVVASVGAGGIFWRDALNTLRGSPVSDPLTTPLFAPQAQTSTLWRLAEAGLISAAMDNSDGLIPTLSELAVASDVTVNVQLDVLSVAGSEALDIDPARLWLGWGDWNVVVCLAPSHFELAKQICDAEAVPLLRVGECLAGGSQVTLTRGTVTAVAPRLESERFVEDSWFRTGIGTYIDRLRHVQIP